MTEQHKVNTYTMFASVTDSPDPVHYEMLGYDTLLGSHYDKYEIDYSNYSPQMPPPDIFDIKGLLTFHFKGLMLPCTNTFFTLYKLAPQSEETSKHPFIILPVIKLNLFCD